MHVIKNGVWHIGDSVEVLNLIPENSVDLVVTSPPYDNLRSYNDSLQWSFDVFKSIAQGLTKCLKDGGVIVWNVSDSTENYSETLTSFKQAIYFKEVCGLKVHDTMLYSKTGFSNPSTTRYHQAFEYVFILSKGRPKTFNPIKDKENKYVGTMGKSNTGAKCKREKFGMRTNIWSYSTGKNQTEHHSSSAFSHPAPMHKQLALDHMVSWSNEGDVVLDPFAGSGTTAVAAENTGRKWFCIERDEEYSRKAIERINAL